MFHKTVEKHLTAGYRKRGGGGREDLAAALAKE